MQTELTIPELGRQQRQERRDKQQGVLLPLKLMIATPHYMSQCFSHYTESLTYTAQLLEKAGVPWMVQNLNGDSYIDRAKNSIVANFLESDCTDLLMIDSDMQWHPDAVGRMLRHEQEIVGGFFPMKNNWGEFCGALLPDSQGNIPDISTAIELWDGACLFRAYLLPGGFLRLKRTILERFADYYADHVYIDPLADPSKQERVYTEFFACERNEYVRNGEDATFCRRVRDMGEALWVDPNISFGHYGVKGFHGNFHKSLLKPEEELAKIRRQRDIMESSVKFMKLDDSMITPLPLEQIQEVQCAS